jgi:hypothetical protein
MRFSITTCRALAAALAIVIATAASQTALAQEGGRPEQVDRALKERYGDKVTAEIVGTPSDINGVKVFRVKIRQRDDGGGESTALVTQYGDFLLSGTPSQFKQMPDDVRQANELFRADPQNAEAFIADGYYIDVQQEGDRFYRLRYDPVGRLREIANPTEVERYETTNFKKADENIAGKVQELAEKRIPQGSKIKDVYIDPRYQGFYVAKYEAPKGGEILVILDERGNIYQTRTEIDRGELPPPIRENFRTMFDEGKVKYTYRTQYQYYQFDQQTPQGDRLTFRVRPNGSIMDVQNVEAAREDEAVQARFREGERGTETGPQRPRDRDR